MAGLHQCEDECMVRQPDCKGTVVVLNVTFKGSEVLKYLEISSPLLCKKIRISAIEIWALKKLLTVQKSCVIKI